MNDTKAQTSSSPPAFMAKVEEAVEPVAEPKKVINTDDLNFRSATIVKATGRLTEQADYLTKISDAITKTLPGFVAENPLGECIDRYVILESQVDAVDTALKLIKAQISMAREVFFPTRMDEEHTKTSTSESGIRMNRTARTLASIRPHEDGTDPAYKWLRENDLGALIKETVNSSSLCAAAKEMIENGKELPDDLFNVHLKDGVSITKPAGKKGK